MGSEGSEKTRILIVDDNEPFRRALKASLEPYGFNITEAAGGKAAQEIIGLEDFGVVITDIRMPEGNGLELMHYIRRAKPMPVILMSGVPELSDTASLTDDSTFFIAKPFKKEEIITLLSKILEEKLVVPSEEPPPTYQDSDFCKLSIESFVNGREIQSDIYIRLGENRFIKIAHRGKDLQADRIAAYRKKGLTYFYMKKEDFRRYVDFNLNLSIALTRSTVQKERKLKFLSYTNDLILEQIHSSQIEVEVFENANTLLNNTVSIISSIDDLYLLLESLSRDDNWLYAHSLGVSLHSSMLARVVGWHSPPVIFKVSLGGLLHDIGKKELPKEIVDKPTNLLTSEERKLYESHTIRGVEILSKLSIPEDIIHIVSQHHENCLGLGFPARLKPKLIHPLAKLVSVANEFCKFIIKNPNRKEPCSPVEGVEKLSQLYADTLDPVFVEALAKLYSVTLPETYLENIKKKKTF